MAGMESGYNQFCPIAKASEVLAQRWTPLTILRELMADIRTFNDLHRDVPLISRAVLVARLRDLELQGIIERRARKDAPGHEYWLTPAGDTFRPVVSELGHWGLVHARDTPEARRSRSDPAVMGLPQAGDTRGVAGAAYRRTVRVLWGAGEQKQVPHLVADT